MDFELTEEQKQIQALIREFCKREVDDKKLWKIAEKTTTINKAEDLRDSIPWELLKKLWDVGLRQLAVPKKYGGGDAHLGGWMTRVTAAEEAGYSGGQLGRFLTIPWKFCADIATCATPEQQDWFFTRFMAKPDMFLAAAQSEPEGMTDIAYPYDEPGVAMKTRAVKDGNHWVINGNKMYCSGGAVADYIMVAVRTDKDGPVSKSVTLFWVERDSPGMELELNNLMLGDMTGNTQIHFDDCRVPEEQMIGGLNEGWQIVASRHAAKLIHEASHMGRCRKFYEQILDYSKQRVQGGKVIIKHPNVAQLVAEGFVNLEATRSLMYKAAWEYDQEEKRIGNGLVNPMWGSLFRYYWRKMAVRLAEIGADVWGGVGVSKDMPLEKFVMRLFYGYHGGSTPTMNLIKAAKHL